MLYYISIFFIFRYIVHLDLIDALLKLLLFREIKLVVYVNIVS
jgi:hypothetical protein